MTNIMRPAGANRELTAGQVELGHWKVSMKTDDQPPAKDTFLSSDPHGPVRTGPLLGASSLRTQNV